MARPRAVTFAWVLAIGCISLLFLGLDRFSTQSYLLESSASAPIQSNSLIQFNVPITELQATNVGDIVKGQFPMGSSGQQVAFTGQVLGGQGTSDSTGALTIKVISDHYMQPGTEVTGRVGNRLFAGTVINSPSNEERLLNLEKRLTYLEKPANDQVNKLESSVKNMKLRVSAIEGPATMKDRITALEKRIFALKHRSLSISPSLFKDNEEGFHFHGAIGPNKLMPKVDKMVKAVMAAEHEPSPERVVEPIMRRLDDAERRIHKLTTGGSSGSAKDLATILERRLVKLEHQAGVYAGDVLPSADAPAVQPPAPPVAAAAQMPAEVQPAAPEMPSADKKGSKGGGGKGASGKKK